MALQGHPWSSILVPIESEYYIFNFLLIINSNSNNQLINNKLFKKIIVTLDVSRASYIDILTRKAIENSLFSSSHPWLTLPLRENQQSPAM